MTEDARLYVTDTQWDTRVRSSSEKMHCFLVRDGEDHYHRILTGEVYLTDGKESYCLDCALKKGTLTRVRPVLPG